MLQDLVGNASEITLKTYGSFFFIRVRKCFQNQINKSSHTCFVNQEGGNWWAMLTKTHTTYFDKNASN
jgi:hypothetical protein